MESFKIEASKTTPKIDFEADKGRLEMLGESYPENSLEFYKPVLEWLKAYLGEYSGKVFFNFKMNYFNTSSSKAILDILDLLDEYFNRGRDIEARWYYEKGDEDILESGEEFAHGLSLPYKLVSF